MQPAFVTGATGFLGSHLVCALLQKGWEVRALKRPASSLSGFLYVAGLYFGQDWENVSKNLVWVEGDLNDTISYEDQIDGNTLVFHCAALVSFLKSDKERLMETNIRGTENLVNVCLFKGCKKLVYVSSTAAVGNATDRELTTEEDLWDEKDRPSNYSISKFFAELEVWRGVEEGLRAVIVNPSMIIGPGDTDRGTGRFFKNAASGFPFYTTGTNAFVYVKDVVKAMTDLADSDISGERFLLPGENISLKSFMDMLADAYGTKRPSIRAGRILSGLAWRVLGIYGFLTGSRQLITRETAGSGRKKVAYSGEKIKKAIGFEFTPIARVVSETVSLLPGR